VALQGGPEDSPGRQLKKLAQEVNPAQRNPPAVDCFRWTVYPISG